MKWLCKRGKLQRKNVVDFNLPLKECAVCDVELSVKARRSLFGTDKRFVSRVNELFSVVLHEDDHAPGYVCKLCYDQINRLYTDKFKLERLACHHMT